MWDLNTLAFRYYLEDAERAAHHDLAEQKHRERSGSFQSLLTDLMQVLTSVYSPFAASSTNRSR